MKRIALTLACAIINVFTADAQLIGGNAFLQGHFLEIGLYTSGAFGAAGAPSGYHPHPMCCSTSPTPGADLGAVYDFGHDGWSTGATPFMGDFTYAGSPFEGWEVQIGGGRGQAFRSGPTYSAAGVTLSGSIVSFSSLSCGGAVATWAGSAVPASGGNMDIRMDTRVDTNASWVVMDVRLLNTGSTTLPNIYYLRSCDPDGDQTWPGGGFSTNNMVVYQNDMLHRVMVKAQGFTYPASYMGLGTVDARAVAFIYNSWPLASTVDLSTCWNQTYSVAYYNVGVNHPGDIAIGLVFSLGSLAPGDSVTLKYYYVFGGPADLDSASSVTASNNGPLCEGETLKLFGNATGCSGTLHWYGPGGFSSGLQDPVIPGATLANAGTYYFVRNSTDTASTTVVINPSPAPITGPATLCAGAIVTLSDAVSGGTWSSSNPAVASIGSSTGVVTGVSAGTCIITYRLASGCYTTRSIGVFSQPAPMTGGSVCATYTLPLTNATPGGAWSSGMPTVAVVDASGNVTGVSAGIAVITYSFGAGCFVTATVTVNPLADAGVISGPPTMCTGRTVTLTESVTGGTWSGSSAVASVSSSGVVTSLTAGTAVISYSVTNGCGTVAATKTITVVTQPHLAGRQQMCQGDTVHLEADVSGGAWQSGNMPVATVSAGVVTGVSAGIAVISYYLDTGCAALLPVTVNPLPPAGSISGSARLCPGAVVTLSQTLTGGKWHSSDTAILTIDSTGKVTAKRTGTVTITYQTAPNANGCVNTATHTITISNATFVISPVISPVSCFGLRDGSITLAITGSTGPFTYEWSTGSAASSIAQLDTGLYSVKVLEPGTQCEQNDTFRITQPDSLTIADSVTNDLCGSATGKASVYVAGGTIPYSYLWSNAATGSGITAITAGVYSVTVMDKNSCKATLTLSVADSCEDIVVHNAMSPNGDGLNDTWVVEGIQSYASNTVQVFDKWGDLVFEQGNYRNDWSGKGKGGVLPDGTYYYLVKLNAVNATGGKDTFTGALLIKR